MNPLCPWVERLIARSAARDEDIRWGWARRHMERCPECARAAKDFRTIRDGLASALDAPEPSEAFVANMWAAIDAPGALAGGHAAPGRRPAMSALGWAGAVAVAATAGLVVVHSLRRAPILPGATPTREVRIARDAGQPDTPVNRQAAAESPDRRGALRRTARDTARAGSDGDRKASKRDTAAERAAIQRMLRQRQRLASGKAAPKTEPAAGRPAASATSDASDRSAAAVSWAELGYYYEAQSDVSNAAYAYRQAWREQGGAAAAFAAGRTSEAAGDILSAVECFAEILDDANGARSSGDGAWIMDSRGIGVS